MSRWVGGYFWSGLISPKGVWWEGPICSLVAFLEGHFRPKADNLLVYSVTLFPFLWEAPNGSRTWKFLEPLFIMLSSIAFPLFTKKMQMQGNVSSLLHVCGINNCFPIRGLSIHVLLNSPKKENFGFIYRTHIQRHMSHDMWRRKLEVTVICRQSIIWTGFFSVKVILLKTFLLNRF